MFVTCGWETKHVKLPAAMNEKQKKLTVIVIFLLVRCSVEREKEKWG